MRVTPEKLCVTGAATPSMTSLIASHVGAGSPADIPDGTLGTVVGVGVVGVAPSTDRRVTVADV